MKVGLLVESGREGLEAVVCRKICDLLASENEIDLTVEIVPMDNKARLLEECASVANIMLTSGCERVVVLWDERPAWPKANERPCWHNDRLHALGKIQGAEIPAGKVHLVCVEREFESWLMFDHGMLSTVLSRTAHPVAFPKQRRPDRNKNPKGTLTSKFQELAGKRYVDVQFARRFALALTSLNKLTKCNTFKRFASKIADLDL